MVGPANLHKVDKEKDHSKVTHKFTSLARELDMSFSLPNTRNHFAMTDYLQAIRDGEERDSSIVPAKDGFHTLTSFCKPLDSLSARQDVQLTKFRYSPCSACTGAVS